VPTLPDEEMLEPGSRYIDFLVPGLVGMGLMGGGMWGVGFAIVDMRIRKLLKRFVATPMRRTDFLLGIMISRLVFMIPEVLVILIFARVFFGVVMSGSFAAVFVLILVGAFTFAGLGLLTGCRAKTLETASGLMNLTMLPMWLLSGIFFSPDRFARTADAAHRGPPRRDARRRVARVAGRKHRDPACVGRSHLRPRAQAVPLELMRQAEGPGAGF
jgi:ABC-type multidrug transport system permease subunit